MISAPVGSLLTYVSQVPDPRGRQGLRHPLSAMLASVVCAVLCGHRRYQAIVQWLHLQPAETWHRLGFTRRPPKSTCFEEVMARLPAEELEQALSRWIQEGLELSVEGELRAVALDGKSLRGTLGPHTGRPSALGVGSQAGLRSQPGTGGREDQRGQSGFGPAGRFGPQRPRHHR